MHIHTKKRGLITASVLLIAWLIMTRNDRYSPEIGRAHV